MNKQKISCVPDRSTTIRGGFSYVVCTPRCTLPHCIVPVNFKSSLIALSGDLDGHCISPVNSDIWPLCNSGLTTLTHSQWLKDILLMDVGYCAADKAADNQVMWVLCVLCKFSLLHSQQNNSDLSINVLDNALKWFYYKQGAFQWQKMSKTAKAKVDQQLATESHQLRKHRLIKFLLQCTFFCMQLNRLLPVNEGNLRCIWMESY